jgi:hypothetical protein
MSSLVLHCPRQKSKSTYTKGPCAVFATLPLTDAMPEALGGADLSWDSCQLAFQRERERVREAAYTSPSSTLFS